VLLKNDCEKGAGVDLARKYEVRVYPTFAMVNQAGDVTDRWAGYEGVEGLIAQVEAARADMSTIAAKKERFQAEPTLPLAVSLAQYSEAVFANSDAVGYYRHIAALDPSRDQEMRRKTFQAMYYGLRTQEFTVDQLLAEGRTLLADPQIEPSQVVRVAMTVKSAAPAAAYVPFLQQALDATAAAEPADEQEAAAMASYRRQLAVDEALLIQRDRPRGLQLRRELLEDGWQDDATSLNRFAWWCHENNLNLDEALTLALRGAELAASDADRANILDTAAALAFKLGDFDRAVALQGDVVALSPERARFRQALERYEAARAAPAGEIVEPRTKAVYPARLIVAAGERDATLAATGVGVRQRTLLKLDVYTIASYVSAGVDLDRLAGTPGGLAEGIRALDAPKRVQLDLRRGIARQQLIDSFKDVIAKNYRDTAAFDRDLDVFLAYFDRDAQPGDRLVFDYLPGTGLVTSVNGEVKGTIANAALMEALWTVWFGEKPADAGLQRALTAAG
jgi:hypothetical protein